MWQDKLKEIIYILEHSDVNEIDLTFLGRRFRVVKAQNAATEKEASTGSTVSKAAVGSISTEPISAAGDVSVSGDEVLSPMPGTFFRASSPNDEPYIKEGDSVKSGDTLCIIEAMKIMNEIEAENSGIVRKILIENGQSVEYNQPLFILEPNG